MGAIKDIVDLTRELETRAKDRHDIELIHRIQSLIISLQSQHADIADRDIRLMQENTDLKNQLAELQKEEVRIHRTIEFRRGPRTGGKWLPFCPKCHMPVNDTDYGQNLCSALCGWKATRLHDMSVLIAQLQ
jgi:hypothetical protein